MHEPYDHLLLRADRSVLRDVVGALRGSVGDMVGAAGGVVHSVSAGGAGIGFASDEVPLLVGWTGERPADGLEGVLAALHLAGAEVVERERLIATARPDAPSTVAASGVVARRWFDIAAADWDEFLELSTSAWVGFEEAFDTEILGFFRSEDVEPPDARVLLMTRYASFAEWERSRRTGPDVGGAAAEAGARFRRRHELTRRTIVRAAPLIPLS